MNAIFNSLRATDTSRESETVMGTLQVMKASVFVNAIGNNREELEVDAGRKAREYFGSVASLLIEDYEAAEATSIDPLAGEATYKRFYARVKVSVRRY